MKLYQVTIVTTIFFSLFFHSCSDDFLDEEIRSSYAPETVNDELGFEAQLIGLYQQVSTFYTQSSQQGWLAVWQTGTDIVWSTQPQGYEIPFYEYNTLTADNGAVLETWTRMYNLVENANSIIYSIENVGDVQGMTEEEKNVVNAEARFFRAWAYNRLALLWGDVPLVTEPISEAKTDYVRAPVADVNALIEEDLTYAVENLPLVDQREQEARVNTYAASHLLANFYLRTEQWQKAEDAADYIINSEEYSLVTERYGVNTDREGDAFSDMFFKGNQRRSQGNTEAIWVLENENPSDVRSGSSGYPQHRRVWGGAYHNINGMIPADTLGGRGLSRIRLNNWVLYDLYPENDMRNSRFNIHRQHWYNDPSSDQYGEPVPYEGADTLYRINPYTLKWGHFDPRDVFGYGMWKDFIFMRLGETYLYKAEAQFRQQDFEGAAVSINMLRDRANAPMVSAEDIDLDFILDERVRELVGEENRRMTLMRTGTLVERANRLQYDVPEQYQIIGLSETNLLFPIPLREIQLNKDGELTQNPGY